MSHRRRGQGRNADPFHDSDAPPFSRSGGDRGRERNPPTSTGHRQRGPGVVVATETTNTTLHHRWLKYPVFADQR
ncbi:hypothetical protein FF1_031079 [Malus domestica]